MKDKVDETVAMIVAREVRLAVERGYNPLNEDGRYEQVLRPIIAAFAYRVPWDAEEIAKIFCSKIREVEAAHERRDDRLPELFLQAMQMEGYATDPIDATAAILLMEEYVGIDIGDGALVATELPPAGERHFFTSVLEVVEFFETFGWENHELVTRLATDGRYCVDVRVQV
jgi:hypothetical protein